MNNLFIFNNFSFKWYSFDSFNSIIFNIFFFEWNILNSAFNGNLLGNKFMSMTSNSYGTNT